MTARTRMEPVVNLRPLPLVAGTMSLFRVGKGWVTPSTALANGRLPPLATPPAVFCSSSGCNRVTMDNPLEGTSPQSNSGRRLPLYGEPAWRHGSNIALFKSRSRLSHPSPTAPRFLFGDRRRGRSVENAQRPALFSGAGRFGPRWARPSGVNTAHFNRHGKVRRSASVLLTYTVSRRTLSRVRSTRR